MLYSIELGEGLEKLNELVSLKDRVKAVRLQDKQGKHNCPEDMKKVFEPATETTNNVSDDSTKTLMIISTEINPELDKLNTKLLEIMNDRGPLASCSLSLLFTKTNPDSTSQFKLRKDSNSNRVNDLRIQNSKPVILHENVLIFRDTGKLFELKEDLLKMITIEIYNVDLASLQDKKLNYDFA